MADRKIEEVRVGWWLEEGPHGPAMVVRMKPNVDSWGNDGPMRMSDPGRSMDVKMAKLLRRQAALQHAVDELSQALDNFSPMDEEPEVDANEEDEQEKREQVQAFDRHHALKALVSADEVVFRIRRLKPPTKKIKKKVK